MQIPVRGSLEQIEEGHQLQILFNENGLIPVVTQDNASCEVLMLGWMNRDALERTLATGMAHYWSRARQQIWKKGERSGQAQLVNHILVDDDQDCLLLKVTLTNGASCHVGYRSCFFRELNVRDGHTDFSLTFLETEKVYQPKEVYGENHA
jgi:phosphoribosyl-AMP cyclohydrolase